MAVLLHIAIIMYELLKLISNVQTHSRIQFIA